MFILNMPIIKLNISVLLCSWFSTCFIFFLQLDLILIFRIQSHTETASLLLCDCAQSINKASFLETLKELPANASLGCSSVSMTSDLMVLNQKWVCDEDYELETSGSICSENREPICLEKLGSWFFLNFKFILLYLNKINSQEECYIISISWLGTEILLGKLWII